MAFTDWHKLEVGRWYGMISTKYPQVQHILHIIGKPDHPDFIYLYYTIETEGIKGLHRDKWIETNWLEQREFTQITEQKAKCLLRICGYQESDLQF